MSLHDNQQTLYLSQCEVTSIEGSGNISLLHLENIVLYDLDEDLTIDEMTAVDVVNKMVCSALTNSLQYLNVSVGETSTLLLSLSRHQQRVISVFSPEKPMEILQSNFDEFKRKVADGDNVRDISRKVGSSVQFLVAKLTEHKILPITTTRNALLSQVAQIEDEWRLLCREHSQLLKTEKSFATTTLDEKSSLLSSSTTLRTGLKDAYQSHLDTFGDTPMQVLVSGDVESVEPGMIGLNHRLVMKNVSVLRYDVNLKPDQMEVIDQLQHLNIFVEDSKIHDFNQLGSQSYLGRVILYHRNESRAERNNRSSYDVSVSLLNFADVTTWLDNIADDINSFRSHLEVEGLENSGRWTSKIKNKIKMWERGQDTYLPDTRLSILDEAKERFSKLMLSLDEIKSKQQELIEENKFETLGFRRIRELTADAQNYMNLRLSGLVPEEAEFVI